MRRRRSFFTHLALLGMVCSLVVSLPARAAVGGLDPSFGGDGRVTTDFGGDAGAAAVVVQADGKLVVAGSTGDENGSDFGLARYRSDGTLDTSFSGDGKATTDFADAYDTATAIVVQADGKLIVAGSKDDGNGSDFAVARYRSDGTLDTSFSGDGKATTDFADGYDVAAALVVQADGKLVVAGSKDDGNDSDFAVARYRSDGTLDTSFSGDGKATTDFADGYDVAAALVVQADGKLVVAGSKDDGNGSDFAVARYRSDGTLDTSFSGDGKATTDFGDGYDVAAALVVQADGKLVATGSTVLESGETAFALARYGSNGALDVSFSGDGRLTTDFGGDAGAAALVVQADGKLVAAGSTDDGNGSDFGLARYGSDGTLDASFDGDGRLTTDFDGGEARAAALVVQADGKLVAAGHSALDDGGTEFALARYQVAGTAAPVATDDSYSTNEDLPLAVAGPGVLANDTDAEGDSLTAALVTGPVHGSLTLGSDGSFSYAPAADFSGTDTFSYRASDGTNPPDAATVIITVVPVNDAPVGVRDAFSTGEDIPLSRAAPGVLGNDADADGNPLSAVVVTRPTHGTLTLNPNGSFLYTPAGDYHGPDGFTYEASDGPARSAVTAVTLEVTPVNDAPVGRDDSYSTNEDVVLTVAAAGVLANDSDLEGNALSASLVDRPAHGTLTLGSNGSFVYGPVADFTGTDRFTYRAVDATAASPVATVTLTVGSIKDPPVARGNSYRTAEDTALTVPAPGVLGDDTDGDGDRLTAVPVAPATHGTVTLKADGSFVYVPHADFHGADAFTYQANDGTDQSAVATVTVTVDSVNDTPVAGADTGSTNEDTPLTVAAPGVLGNDRDADSSRLNATLVSAPTHGTLTLLADGSFTYIPSADSFGTDVFTYVAGDGAANSSPTAVTIMVNPVDDRPVAVDDRHITHGDRPVIVGGPGVLGNDRDVDGDPLTAVLVGGPAHGTVILNADGSFSYAPAASFPGTDAFTYQASDGRSLSDPATVTVTAVNHAPLASGEAFSTDENTSLTVGAPGVLGNDTDPDGDALHAVVAAGPAHGTLALNPGGAFVYTPAASYHGPDSFTYRASDGTASSTVATVAFTVIAVNSAPVAGADSYQITLLSTVLRVPAPGVLGNDTDIDGDRLSAVLVSGPTRGTLTLNPDGSFTYRPSLLGAADTFTYRASDGTALSAPVTVTLRSALTRSRSFSLLGIF